MLCPRPRREAPQVALNLPRFNEVAVSAAAMSCADVNTFVLDDQMTSPIGRSTFVQLNNSTVHVFRDDDSMFWEASTSVLPSGEVSAVDISDAEAQSVLSRASPMYSQLEIGKKQLGRGSQGFIFPARWEGERVAVKVFDLEDINDHTSDLQRRAKKHAIIRELQMVRTVCDSKAALHYIVRPHDAFKRANTVVVMMELLHCDLGTLLNQTAGLPRNVLESHAQVVRGKKKLPAHHQWPERVVAAILHDVLSGLNELHEKLGLRHGDIKPSNLLLSKEGNIVKVCDFGCCARLYDTGATGSANFSGVEELGSRLYMAPERLTPGESPPGAASDVWSVGILACELLTGIHPCEAFKSRYWQYQESLDNICKLMPTASNACTQFIQKCLLSKPASRATVSQLLREPFICASPLDRRVLAKFLNGLSTAAEKFEVEQRRNMLADAVRRSMKSGPQQRNHQEQNVQCWKAHTAFLRPPPTHAHPDDMQSYPPLRKK